MTVLVLVSARGAEGAIGLELGATAGGLVCAVTAVRAMKNAAPTQEKVFRRLGICGCEVECGRIINRKQTSPSGPLRNFPWKEASLRPREQPK